jgi:hypothetical protein
MPARLLICHLGLSGCIVKARRLVYLLTRSQMSGRVVWAGSSSLDIQLELEQVGGFSRLQL